MMLRSVSAFVNETIPPAAFVFFQRDIRPVLGKFCIACHGPPKQKGELRQDTQEYLTNGGGSCPSFDGSRIANERNWKQSRNVA